MPVIQYFQTYNLILIWILLGVVARLLPHPPDVTPVLALSLLSGYQFRRRVALLIIISTLLISDMLLGYIEQQVFFGTWTLFTYSGFVVITLLGEKLKAMQKWYLIPCGMLVSLTYWGWTNFGVWLMSGLYPLTLTGFENCFILALPFLTNSLVGDFFWLIVFIFLLHFIRQSSLFEGQNILTRRPYEK